MKNLMKWAAISLGVVMSLVLAVIGYAYTAGEIILQRTYPASPSTVQATVSAESVARGAHLTQIYGCASCHGKDLTGGLFDDIPGMVMWSANLPLLAKTYSDADFDHAIRQGLRKNATSLLLMPSNAYAALPDSELADIISYIRSLPARGEQHPAPRLGLLIHAILAFGLAGTARGELAEGKNARDVGPQYGAGRLLAQIACGECHATDLTGGPAIGPMPARPDLGLVASYDSEDFLKFMRTGKAAGDRELSMMSATSRARFSHFTDPEVRALYDYLVARENALAADVH